MINEAVQKYLLIPLLVISFLFTSGCGILNPPHKDELGFYTRHYYSCGPVAVQEALERYCEKNGIKFKRAITAKQISQDIQRNSPPFIINKRKLLIILDREAAGITWPFEIKLACQKYGVKLTKVHPNQLYLRNRPNATYIVLVHKKWTIDTYHWYAYPNHADRAHYWKGDTVFDVVYMLEPIAR